MSASSRPGQVEVAKRRGPGLTKRVIAQAKKLGRQLDSPTGLVGITARRLRRRSAGKAEDPAKIAEIFERRQAQDEEQLKRALEHKD